MKQTVNFYQFADAFRAIRPNNFSYAALCEIFDYFEEFEDACGEEMELDVIAICCDFTEYTIEEIEREYSHMLDVVTPDYDYRADPSKKADWIDDILTESGNFGCALRIDDIDPMTGDKRTTFVLS